MMKNVAPYIFAIFVWIPVCFGNLDEYEETADGYLSDGEYVDSVELDFNEELFVAGGGADIIDARDYSYVEVRYTSTPLGPNTGIYDITLYDDSELLYLDGITEEITVRDDAAAVLKGGRIDYITIYHLASWSSSVTIYCQEGYLKNQYGISGLWADGSAFNIDFIDVGGVFSPYPTADFVNVEIIPEPATLVLLGLGGLLIRRKK